MPPLRDVIIIGAGPAGAATAARLHQLGVRDVLVLERAEMPRDKPCGGGLTGRCDAALASLGLRLTVPRVAARHARIRFGAFERSVVLPRPVNVVRRGDFDASLAEQVRALGVEVSNGARVTQLAVASDAVTLRLASGEALRARLAIGADGVASVVRRHLRAAAKAAPLRLFVQELAAREPGDGLLFDFTPMLAGVRGYAWAFPVAGGRVNVGVLHFPSTPRTPRELLRVLHTGLARDGIELPSRGTQGWPVWGYDPQAPVAAARLLTVGDAAGVDALTGEGIAVALEQAAIAGAAAARALARRDFGFADYPAALRRSAVGRELTLDRWLAQRAYQAGPGWRRWMRRLLFDADFAELYAARIAGTATLSACTRALWRACGRDLVHAGSRRRAFARACAGYEGGETGGDAIQ